MFAAEHSEIIPLKFEAWQMLSECYLQIGRYDTALVAANKVAAIDPDHPAAWYLGFAIYRAMGNHTAAMQSAETAMSKPMEGV